MQHLTPLLDPMLPISDVGAQGKRTPAGKSSEEFGAGGLRVELPVDEREVDKFLFQAGCGENQVDAFKQSPLLAVVQGAINARKCWTKDGLVGEGKHGSGGWFCLLNKS
jgi:hypothetical protein